MKTTFLITDVFHYDIETKRVDALPGQSHIRITSQLLSANQPHQEHTQFSVTVDADGLQALIGTLQHALGDLTQPVIAERQQ